MAEVTQEQFLQRYGTLLVHTWGMPALKERLRSDPAAVLKEYGMDPEGAAVTILAPGTPNPLGISDPTDESQYRLFVQGKQRGNIPFYVMDAPPEGAGGENLSDEELMAVAGGGNVSCCCSCTPCCCC